MSLAPVDDAAMQLVDTQYRPNQTAAAAPGGCCTCSHNHGDWIAGGAHVLCRQVPDQLRVVGTPAAGCAFWRREPGTD